MKITVGQLKKLIREAMDKEKYEYTQNMYKVENEFGWELDPSDYSGWRHRRQRQHSRGIDPKSGHEILEPYDDRGSDIDSMPEWVDDYSGTPDPRYYEFSHADPKSGVDMYRKREKDRRQQWR